MDKGAAELVASRLPSASNSGCFDLAFGRRVSDAARCVSLAAMVSSQASSAALVSDRGNVGSVCRRGKGRAFSGSVAAAAEPCSLHS